MRRVLFLISFFTLSCLISCRRDDSIQTYRVSKEADATPPMMGAPAAPTPAGSEMQSMGDAAGFSAAGSSKEISWTLPEGWSEKPASAMRVGSFLIKGSNGQDADVSVVPLAGDAGGELANINRWRGQLQLEPIAEEQLPEIRHDVAYAGRSMHWVEFSSKETLIDGKYKRRLIAAIYKQGDRSWFFKMIGEEATVQEAKPAFVRFLKSLRFQEPSS
jgi:hypothetical protein